MERTATVKAKDLPAAERQWIAAVLHLDLADDDEFVVTLRRPVIRIPTPEQRTTARRDLLHAMQTLAEQAKDVPEAEVDAAIEEAVQHVRSQKH